jgi:creatinine amidohydrolase
MLDEAAYRVASPAKVRELIGDGSFGGLYERSDEEMLRIWQAGVEEVRELLESGWR